MTKVTTVITAEELALAESLLSALRASNALGGEHAQYGGTYGAVHEALLTCLAFVYEAHVEHPPSPREASRWACAIIGLTIDSGESVEYAITYALTHPEHATSVAGGVFDFEVWAK